MNKKPLVYLLELTKGYSLSDEQILQFSFNTFMEMVDKLSPSAREELLGYIAEIAIAKPFSIEQSDVILKEIIRLQSHQSCICCLGNELNNVVAMITSGQIKLRPSSEIVEELKVSGKEKASYGSVSYQRFLKILEDSMVTTEL